MKWLTFVGLALLIIMPVRTGGRQSNPGSAKQMAAGRPLSQADEDAIVQAIEDEMYVNNLEPEVIDVGTEVSDSEYQLTAYFKSTLDKDNTRFIIYKLMPYGGVNRLFAVERNGLGVVYGRLKNHFPPTEPSYLTVYMDDDDLCRLKTEWEKSYFTVDLMPSAKRIAEARARQRRRMAY